MDTSSIKTTATFDELMTQAQAKLERRRLNVTGDLYVAEAIELFELATHCVGNADEEAWAFQQLGVACRLYGDYSRAEQSFMLAYQVAERADLTIKLGAILRDWAMLNLSLGNIKDAYGRINQSMLILRACCAQAEDGGTAVTQQTLRDRNCELAATKGFKARILLADGKKWQAINLLKYADRALRGKHDQYERNNLRHWFKAQPWRLDLLVRWIRLEFRIRTGRSNGK